MLLRRTGPRLAALLARSAAPATTAGARPSSASAAPVDENSVAKAHAGWGQTKVADLLAAKGDDKGNYLWCTREDLVFAAIKKMTQHNVGSLLVFEPENAEAARVGAAPHGSAVVGIVTERDYMTKVAVKGHTSQSLRVADIMTGRDRLQTAAPGQSVMEVMALMVKHNIRHMPVVDGDAFLGMVSIKDTCQVMVAEHQEEVRGLHEYIQGSY